MSDYWSLHFFLCDKRQALQKDIEIRRGCLKALDRTIAIFKRDNRKLPVVQEKINEK